MKNLVVIIAIILAMALSTSTQSQTNYPLTPDSQPQPGVPKGEVLKFSFDKSKVFPGTYRDYWVYVPAQYTPDKPACVYVNQDGVQWQAPIVFDNLIHKKEMPITIGVFVMHGRVRPADANAALDRFNRSYEYDGLGDGYARFILDELLPDVETKKTSDGRAIRLSKSGNDRAIGGSSSGAICAFTAAWERPDAFSRVFSAIGTYVGLRGGDGYPTLIRKYEPKPLRIFLQDGSADQNIYGGDWWMANQMMERALTFSGYEVQHAWGDGGHNGQHGTAVFPDAMRFLWKDWPQPVKGGATRNNALNEILVPGEGWQLVGKGYGYPMSPASNAIGEVFFRDNVESKMYKVGTDGKVSELADHPNSFDLAFGPDGLLYTTTSAPGWKIVAYNSEGKAKDIANGISGANIVVAHNGNIYVGGWDTSDPLYRASNPPAPALFLIKGIAKKIVDPKLGYTGLIALSPDQTLLYVAGSGTHWVYSFQIQPDGTLAHKQRYYWLHVPDSADASGASGMCVDTDGRLYVATRMGIQVCDQAGRVNCIIPTPNGQVNNLCFGGTNFDTLHATCGDKLYKRKMKVKGANAWAAPHKPAAPRL